GAPPRLRVAPGGGLRVRPCPGGARLGRPRARSEPRAARACRRTARGARGRRAPRPGGTGAGGARGAGGGAAARRIAPCRSPPARLTRLRADWSEVPASRTLGAMRLSADEAAEPGLLRQITALALIPANAAGAAAVYLYFSYIDPWGGRPQPDAATAFVLFSGLTRGLLVVTTRLGDRWTRPVHRWSRKLRAGASPASVPVEVRRRVLNAALMIGLLSLAAWFVAGLFYLVVLGVGYRIGAFETLRVFLSIVLVGGPVASALAFLVSEYHWRREIPLFFPDGELERAGVLRLPIRIRLLVTFLLTSILPLLLMLTLDLSLQRRVPGTLAVVFRELVRAQLFLVGITAVASTTMALLVARFVHRPIQALRHGMAQVAAGDLTTRVPVRSTDELGELNRHFNSMVEQLRLAA